MTMPDPNSPKNYTNGAYIGHCLICEGQYFGPKRSRICAECTSKEDEDGNSHQADEEA